MADQTPTDSHLELAPESVEPFKPLFEPSGWRFLMFHGGRGGGKSHACAQACLIRGLHQKLRILCCREVQHSMRDSVKRLLDDYIDKLGLRWFYVSTDAEIRGRNGTLIIFAGILSHGTSRRAPVDNIKSMEGIDIAWVEEEQTVSQRSWDLLIRTIRKPHSEIWGTWNPRFPTDPVDSMFRGGQPPDRSLVTEVNYWQNPWFEESELKDDVAWLKKRDYEKYRHTYRGEYQRSTEAAVFRNWKVEDVTAPEDARFLFGADWGFSVDPSVLVRCFIQGRTLYVDREAYAVGCDLDYLPALFAGSDVRFHPNGLPIKVGQELPKPPLPSCQLSTRSVGLRSQSLTQES